MIQWAQDMDEWAPRIILAVASAALTAPGGIIKLDCAAGIRIIYARSCGVAREQDEAFRVLGLRAREETSCSLESTGTSSSSSPF